MSGGSYNYLCYKDASQLGQYHEELENMAERLADLGWAADAAAETYVILNALRRIDALWRAAASSGLVEVWRAVEWWDSGDTGPETLRADLEKFRARPAVTR